MKTLDPGTLPIITRFLHQLLERGTGVADMTIVLLREQKPEPQKDLVRQLDAGPTAKNPVVPVPLLHLVLDSKKLTGPVLFLEE